jgi:uncharacterized protein with PIN domain
LKPAWCWLAAPAVLRDALAKARGLPLLFKDYDFSATDLTASV